MLALFFGACLFRWVLLELYAQGIVRNEVSVIVLPFSAFAANLILLLLFSNIGCSVSKIFRIWGVMVVFGCLVQFWYGAKWQVVTLIGIATIPSVIAYWGLRSVRPRGFGAEKRDLVDVNSSPPPHP
jgi:hypothetical protein